MDRKKFIKSAFFTGVVGAVIPEILGAKQDQSYKLIHDSLKQTVGYNHLPNKEIKTMNTVIHRADTRGKANHGWLNSHHTFSFQIITIQNV